MSTIITPSEEQINIVVNDEKISINVESGDVIVNVNEQIVEVSTVNGGYPLPTTVYSVFGRTGNIIATEGDYDLGELGDVTLVSSTNGDVLTYDGTKWINKAVTGTGTVTSVDMSVPVGLQVSGNPITINGTLALNYAAGYSLPTTAKQTTWDAAYNDSIVSASVSGTTTKTLTLNQQDGGTITASWTDIDTNLVTSVNGYVGTVVLTTSDIAEGSRLYYTETRVSNNTDVAANTAARHSAVTIGTANGLSLASQVLSLALASASTTGALSSTDWSTFNNKQNQLNGSGFVKASGTTISYDNSTYLTSADVSGYVPYTGATANVDLGVFDLTADLITGATGSFASSGGSNTFAINHSSGSGIALNITKGGNGEGLYINKTSGSGNAATIIGTLNATTLVKNGGTSSQFLKADGSVDSSTYYLASNPSAYIALTGLSATAPLSYNNTTGGFTISQAGVSANGYLSSTDWNTFNDKQAAGNYITALSGEATASGPGSAAVTLSTSAVTGKILTGVNITGGSITATDSILVAFGKVQNQINGVLGGAIYQSTWNASTNSPTLTSSTGTKGYYYIVSVAGSTNLDGITDWKIGDWAIFNGATWDKVDNTDAVSSVNGFTGAVSLTTANISEVTNLYYTEGRVSANTDVAANTAARHAAVTLGTANGLSLSTQALSLALASTSATGALSSTDWNTFNLKQAALSGTGFVKISGSTISYDNSTYLTGNQTITLSGDVSGSGATAITTTIGALKVTNAMLAGSIDLTTKVTGLLPDGNISSAATWNAKQAQLNGTGFVKASGTTITYDNSTYLTTSSASSTYLPLTGGTLTGALNINLSSGTALNVAGNAIFRGDTGVGTPRQLIITSGGSTPVYLEAKGYGANYQTDFGIKTFNNVGTAFEVFYADSSGRVGINQTSPSYQLDVNGTGRFSGALTVIGTNSTSANNTITGYSADLYALAIRQKGASAGISGTNYMAQLISATGAEGLEIYTPNAKELVLGTNSTPRLTLASTGAATFSSSVTATSALLNSTSTQLILQNTDGGTNAEKVGMFMTGGDTFKLISLNDNNTTRVDNILVANVLNGNVGIGTSSPYALLSLYKSTAGDRLLIDSNADSGANGAIAWGAGAISNISARIRGIDDGGYGTHLLFETRGNGAIGTTTTERMRITSGGNVGIGTSSPLGKLDVYGGAANTESYIRTNSFEGTYYAALSFSTGGQGANDPQAQIRVVGENNYSASIRFLTQTSGTTNPLAERMRITSGGNLEMSAASDITFGGSGKGIFLSRAGLGPRAALTTRTNITYVDIANSADWSGATICASGGNVLIGTTTDAGYKLYVDGGSSNGMAFYSTSPANQFKIAGSAAAMTFSNTISGPSMGGSLGVATSAGDFLSGTAAGDTIFINQFSGKRLYAVSYSGGVYLSSGATSWTANSDIRLKNINSHIENAVEKLSTLQTINFSYKDDKTNKQNLGLIAQEVEKIFPELIDKNGDGMLGVRYTELVPVLIKAVQELKLEIETLKNK